jgi:two-component sensor histidine kinase
VSVAVGLVLLICAAAALLAVHIDRFGRDQAEGQLLQTTRALSIATDGELKRYEAVLRTLITAQSVRTNDWKAFEPRARAVLSGSSAWIVVGDRSGKQLVNTRLPPGASLPPGGSPEHIWPILDRGRTHICNLAHGRVERDIVCLDVPVMSGGKASHHLSVVIPARELREVVAPQRLQPRGFVTVLDRRGIVIWRNVSAEKFVGSPGTADLRRALLTSGEGVRESVSLEGVPTVVAYSRSPYSGWTVAMAMPRTELTRGIRQGFALAAAGTLILLALAILLGVLAARRISNAVASLSTIAETEGGDTTGYSATGLREIDAVGTALAEAVRERQAGDERQRLLINELNHRVKNTLAVVQSIAQQTLRSGGADPGVVRSLESRLAALSAAHDVLTRESWASASMREIIERALGPFCSAPRCLIEGPDLRLSPRTSVSLALVFHELGTNASKYGALSNEEGCITIRWSIQDERLKLIWSEAGGPLVRPPARRGFGSRMLERMLSGELGGTTRLDFPATGVVFTIDAPIPELEGEAI